MMVGVLTLAGGIGDCWTGRLSGPRLAVSHERLAPCPEDLRMGTREVKQGCRKDQFSYEACLQQWT